MGACDLQPWSPDPSLVSLCLRPHRFLPSLPHSLLLGPSWHEALILSRAGSGVPPSSPCTCPWPPLLHGPSVPSPARPPRPSPAGPSLSWVPPLTPQGSLVLSWDLLPTVMATWTTEAQLCPVPPCPFLLTHFRTQWAGQVGSASERTFVHRTTVCVGLPLQDTQRSSGYGACWEQTPRPGDGSSWGLAGRVVS